MNILQELIELKRSHNLLVRRLHTLKTKKAQSSCRDKLQASRKAFNIAAEGLSLDGVELWDLNIMSMVGGPYYVAPRSKVEVRQRLGSCLQVCIDSEWAGMIYLLDDKCGMDNLKLIANQLNVPYQV